MRWCEWNFPSHQRIRGNSLKDGYIRLQQLYGAYYERKCTKPKYNSVSIFSLPIYYSISKIRSNSCPVTHRRQTHQSAQSTPDIAFVTCIYRRFPNSSISLFTVRLRRNRSRIFPIHKTFLPSCSPCMTTKLWFLCWPDLSISQPIRSNLCRTEVKSLVEWLLFSMTVDLLSSSLQSDSAGTKLPFAYKDWKNCRWTMKGRAVLSMLAMWSVSNRRCCENTSDSSEV